MHVCMYLGFVEIELYPIPKDMKIELTGICRIIVMIHDAPYHTYHEYNEMKLE